MTRYNDNSQAMGSLPERPITWSWCPIGETARQNGFKGKWTRRQIGGDFISLI